MPVKEPRSVFFPITARFFSVFLAVIFPFSQLHFPVYGCYNENEVCPAQKKTYYTLSEVCTDDRIR